MTKILVIAAHPDDETLGCGGMITRSIKEGNQVAVCIVTDGCSARHQMKSMQKKACDKALKVLGVKKTYFLGFKDQRLDKGSLLQVIKKIEGIIQDFKPESVYTNFIGDLNKDHQITAEATLVACRPYSGVKDLLYYETPSSTEWGLQPFVPNFYMDISDFYLFKSEAFGCYSKTLISEVRAEPHPRSHARLLALAELRGSQCNHDKAEAFMVVRRIA